MGRGKWLGKFGAVFWGMGLGRFGAVFWGVGFLLLSSQRTEGKKSQFHSLNSR